MTSKHTPEPETTQREQPASSFAQGSPARPGKTSVHRDARRLQFVIRTPRDVIVDQPVRALRVPTRSGQVGLRPRGEPTVLAVEAGLIVLRLDNAVRYAGTAGGLLHADRTAASLLTPLAVVGESVADVSQALDALLSASSEEMEVRGTLGRLETRILRELHDGDDRSAAVKGGA